MSDLLSNVLVPVAGEDDAAATCGVLVPRLSPDSRVTAVHVVEKAGGAPDKASVEQREEVAEAAFDVVERECETSGIAVETRVVYATDVADGILDAADDVDASAIVFTPRGGSRWLDLLTGDVSRSLVKRADRPVVVLPDGEDEESDGTDDESEDGGGGG